MDPFTVPTLTTVLGWLLPEPHAGLLAGILFGTRASLSRELTDAFITTGTIHIIALSGQNVSIVSAFTATLLTVLFSRRIASLLTLLVLASFLWFVGPSPSLVRAVIMGSLTILAVIFGKRNLGILSLALAVSSMLLLNPLWITDLGFQLSVLATLGIILFGGSAVRPPSVTPDFSPVIPTSSPVIPAKAGIQPSPIEHLKGAWARVLRSTEDHEIMVVEKKMSLNCHSRASQRLVRLWRKSGNPGFLNWILGSLRKDSGQASPRMTKNNDNGSVLFALIRASYSFLVRVIANDLRITLAAQLFTTPLIFFAFRRLSLIAPVTNVAIGWAMPLVMILGWFAAIAGYVWLPLGILPAWAAWVLLSWVIGVVELTANLPLASLSW